MSHDGFFGEGGRSDRIEAAGHSYHGENLAWGTFDLNEQVGKIHEDWMGSPKHRLVLQDVGFELVGYGYHACERGPTREQDGSPRADGPMERSVMYWAGEFANK